MDSHTLSHPLHRAGSALASVTAPNRVRTEPPRPEKQTLHRRLQSNTITSRTRPYSTRINASNVRDAVVHSAAELRPPISFDHILRRDKKSSEPNGRESASASQKGDSPAQVNAQQRKVQDEARRVKPADIIKAKKENEKREGELRHQLQSLEEVAMSSTRQLDDTHYAILEKASTLRAMVEGLWRLAEEARSTRETFVDESKHLDETTNTSLDAFNDFGQQEKSIHDLVTKLKASRTATEKLNARLEAARQRVGAYEKREIDKENTRKKQLQMTWGTLLATFILLTLVVILRNRRDVAYKLDGIGNGLATTGDVLMDGIASPISELILPTHTEDPRLKRLFDEL